MFHIKSKKFVGVVLVLFLLGGCWEYYDHIMDNVVDMFIRVDNVYEKKYATESQKRKLFKSLGCEYTHDLSFKDGLDKKMAINKDDESKDDDVEFTKKYEKDVKNKTLAPMYLKFISPKVGYGIFAAEIIHKGDFIGIYSGELRPFITKNGEESGTEFAWEYLGTMFGDQRILVDGKYRGNDLRFINHSKNPNTKVAYLFVDGMWYVVYIAQEEIKKGQQLTVSYGESYWSTREIIPFDLV